MTATLSVKTLNPYITAVEAALHGETTPAQWLAIVHNDSRLKSTLPADWAGASAALLPVSQDHWDFRPEGQLAEAITWALQQGEIDSLLLVGSSQVGGAILPSLCAAPGTKSAVALGYGRLLAGTARRQAQNRHAQERFADQFEQLLQIRGVQIRSREGSLTVHGLFYRDESGLFLAFDPENRTFRALC